MVDLPDRVQSYIGAQIKNLEPYFHKMCAKMDKISNFKVFLPNQERQRIAAKVSGRVRNIAADATEISPQKREKEPARL